MTDAAAFEVRVMCLCCHCMRLATDMRVVHTRSVNQNRLQIRRCRWCIANRKAPR